ncbi:MAG: hypothetical protein BWY73_00396 [candidate division TA06 bacterium ADurb.Bin417]|uniref:Uncharacterized protein n=1 Tax=candidate division TA06 bacterium ADurb.Bin417 TaxID=1852828 RepID=A0A1V5MJA1_UNCT6|nr:MAG: hypothetical protein BWY73_00396 [candidate division TA06 bacterium ADurb.Bin417]
MVEHAAQRILGVLVGGGILDRLRNGDAQAAGRAGHLHLDAPAAFGLVAGRGEDLGSPGLHHDAPVGFLLVAALDHVDRALEAQQLAGQRQGAAPLAGSGFSREAGDALLLIVVSLGDCGVGLVAAGRAGALVLVPDLGLGAQGLLQPAGPAERSWSPEPVDLQDRIGNFDPAFARDLLGHQAFGKDRVEVLRFQRFAGGRVAGRRQRGFQIGQEVIPLLRNFLLGEENSFFHDRLRFRGYGPFSGRGNRLRNRGRARVGDLFNQWPSR